MRVVFLCNMDEQQSSPNFLQPTIAQSFADDSLVEPLLPTQQAQNDTRSTQQRFAHDGSAWNKWMGMCGYVFDDRTRSWTNSCNTAIPEQNGANSLQTHFEAALYALELKV